MEMQKVLLYLSNLESNNNREWYHANKTQYKEADHEFVEFIQELIYKIGEIDSSILHLIAKDLTFKLNRDTRFSNDKSPYNPTFRAHISSKGKLPVPVGYYISIRPQNRSFIGGGLFTSMFKDATNMIRDYIVKNGSEFEKIINNKKFIDHFTVKGEALKNVPLDYDKNHPQAEYLKNKSWYLEYPIEDSLLLDSEKIFPEVIEKFVLMQPFNNFLNKALSNFNMPIR